MVWSIRFTEEAREGLHDLHIDKQREIKRAVKKLANGSEKGKALTGRLERFYSFRIGKYRIVYTLDKDFLTVHVVGHRRDVYKLSGGD